ncbi:MAG: pilus assembly protein [Micavibrio aeruginosavorus]|uniref:Pilus assembly protein n=1 Tax=Micavibrio aeruginosavorus TaxID=349221 RepID=A0A2W5PYZ7_9BACT|nr:MAG: pilus assembly protein [Micavibrio aeruginosavorus]
MGLLLKTWWKRDEGATAVEFSLVGFPFVLMTIGILEMALMFTSQSMLQEATFTASRLIRTGQIQQAGGTETMFRDAVCGFAELLIPCSRIQFQVQQLPSFSDADDMPPVFDADGNLTDTPFDPGVENDVVLVRVVYNYPIRTPLMKPVLSNATGGKRTMISTIVLQTEPYE